MKPFIFISPPRTGTYTVRAVLGFKDRFNHRPASFVRRQVGEEVWKKSYKFAFVRNPFDRLVSWYCFHREGNVPPGTTTYQRPFKDWVMDGCPHHWGPKTFGSKTIDFHPLMLTDYLMEDGQLIVDFVGRVENFEHDMRCVCMKLKAPHRKDIPQCNRSNRSRYQNYYDEESIRRVEDMFREDLMMFNYRY